MTQKIEIVLKEGGCMPVCNGECYDLATAVDVDLKKGEKMIIPLGVVMKAPEGYFIKVYPRSSTHKKWNILMANSVGIIDRDYCGDDDIIGFPAYATDDTHIPKGTRIAQFILEKQMDDLWFYEVETTGHDNRGGYGSTGER